MSRLNGKITPLDRTNTLGHARRGDDEPSVDARARADWDREHPGVPMPTATYERPRSRFFGGRLSTGRTPSEAAQAMEKGLAEEGDRRDPPPPSRFSPVTDRYTNARDVPRTRRG